MGRPRKKERNKAFPITLEPDLYRTVCDLAEEAGCKRGTLLREFVGKAVRAHLQAKAFLESTGRMDSAHQ